MTYIDILTVLTFALVLYAAAGLTLVAVALGRAMIEPAAAAAAPDESPRAALSTPESDRGRLEDVPEFLRRVPANDDTLPPTPKPCAPCARIRAFLRALRKGPVVADTQKSPKARPISGAF